MLINIHKKQHKKIVDSSIISNYNTVKQRPIFLCFFFLSNLSYLVQLMLKSYEVQYLNWLDFINYLYPLLMFFNNTLIIILPKLQTATKKKYFSKCYALK